MYSDAHNPAGWVLSRVLAAQAQQHGAAPLARLCGQAETLSYEAAAEQADQVASYLQALGVAPGDRVACLMASSLDFVRLWLGAARLGAVFVPLNTELTGNFLQYQLNACRARFVAVDRNGAQALAKVADELPHLSHALLCGDAAGHTGGDLAVGAALDRLCPQDFRHWRRHDRYQGLHPRPQDIGCIIYTSGTTGPSKGVLMPHAHCFLFALGSVEACEITPADIYYIVLPLFHVNGLFMQLYATLIGGAVANIRPRFSAGAFFDELIACGATITNVLGSVSAYLFAQAPAPRERAHRLRLVQQTPNIEEAERTWRERFGVPHLITGYGMTEVNICAWTTTRDTRINACGKPYSRYFDLIVADPQTDQPVPAGQVGEILVRPKVPFGLMAGYDGMAEATVTAWRNLWFHTGDAGSIDADGYLYFIDRMKDCIRRGGENISSYEVEQAIMAFGDIQEVAAFPVPADRPGTEDEVMLAVLPQAGQRIDIDRLIEHADQALPRFARPRYIDIVEELPRTPTAKVKKAELRKRGVTAATVDCREHRARSG